MDMMGSRHRNTRRPPWPQSSNNEHWQPRSNVSSFGYRRHELADKPSTRTFMGDSSEEAPAYVEDYNGSRFRGQPRGCFQSQNAYGADSRDIESYYPAGNAKQSADYEINDLVKAASDTDFRFSPHRPDEGRGQFPNRNPYRTVPTTAQEQSSLVPALRSTCNPWKTEVVNDETRRNLVSEHPRSANRGIPTFEPLQRAANAESSPLRGLLPVLNLAPSRTPPSNSRPHSAFVWDKPPNPAEGNRGYFEELRQREQERNMFGKSHGPQSTFQRGQPPVGNGSHQTLAFAGSNNTPTFSNYGIRDTGTHPSQSATGPRGGRHAGIQGTWRGRAAKKGKLSSRGTGACRPTSNCQPNGPNGASVGGGCKSAGSDKTHSGVTDARLVLDRKRKCASEEDIEKCVPLHGEQFAAGTFSGSTQLSSKVALVEELQHDTKLFVENHFLENNPAQSHTPDVHEVDESQLWPPDVSPEAVSYVIFLDIDRRSFFDESKQPFLPGTLLYLFYGDPSVLLPTKEHPFYRDNKGNWVHFYPDCGTEYGSYVLAAPAVINWMDQKVPHGVKFLVHGSRKQLNLNDVSRRILFYPTSRTMDIPLLNRMLRGDFDVPNPPKTAAPTAIKPIVIRSTTRAPPPAVKSKLSPNLANKKVPVHASPPPHPQASSNNSSFSGCAPPAHVAKTSTRIRKHPPILAPGQEPSKKERVPRQKICWDL